MDLFVNSQFLIFVMVLLLFYSCDYSYYTLLVNVLFYSYNLSITDNCYCNSLLVCCYFINYNLLLLNNFLIYYFYCYIEFIFCKCYFISFDSQDILIFCYCLLSFSNDTYLDNVYVFLFNWYLYQLHFRYFYLKDYLCFFYLYYDCLYSSYFYCDVLYF